MLSITSNTLDEAYHNVSSKCLQGTFRYGFLVLGRSLSRSPFVTLRSPRSSFSFFFSPVCAGFVSYIRCHFDLLLLRRLCHTDPQSQFQKTAPTSAASDYIWRSTISRLRFEALSGQLALLVNGFPLTHWGSSLKIHVSCTLLVRILSSKTKYGR